MRKKMEVNAIEGVLKDFDHSIIQSVVEKNLIDKKEQMFYSRKRENVCSEQKGDSRWKKMKN